MALTPTTPLPDDVPTLQALVRELLAEVATLRQTVARQQERIDALTRQLYGRSSERVPPTPGPLPHRLPWPRHPPRHHPRPSRATAGNPCPPTCPANGSNTI